MSIQVNDPLVTAPVEIRRSQNRGAVAKKMWLHVDMDGLDAIYAGHGQAYRGSSDDFYVSAVDNSLITQQVWRKLDS